MTQPHQAKPRILAYVLIAIGVVTLSASTWWCNSVLGLVLYFGDIGGETNWPNVIGVLVVATLLGAAPLVAGLFLLFRRRV